MDKLPKPKKHYGLREVMHSLNKCETVCCKELENLRADKKRMDWLEKHGHNRGLQFPGLSLSRRKRMRWGIYTSMLVRTFSGKTARKTIDAAMRSPQ